MSLPTAPFLRDSLARTTFSACGLTLDIGRQRLTETDLRGLLETAREKGVLGANAAMREGQIVEVMFHTEKETVLSAELPPIIDMEVTYTEPGVKGDTASTNSLKPATVDTGATIRVPLFIQTGEKIRVDSRTREYSERIKE